jgi:hypothetical protein
MLLPGEPFYCQWGLIRLILSVAKVKKEMLKKPHFKNDFKLIIIMRLFVKIAYRNGE